MKKKLLNGQDVLRSARATFPAVYRKANDQEKQMMNGVALLRGMFDLQIEYRQMRDEPPPTPDPAFKRICRQMRKEPWFLRLNRKDREKIEARLFV